LKFIFDCIPTKKKFKFHPFQCDKWQTTPVFWCFLALSRVKTGKIWNFFLTGRGSCNLVIKDPFLYILMLHARGAKAKNYNLRISSQMFWTLTRPQIRPCICAIFYFVGMHPKMGSLWGFWYLFSPILINYN